MRKYISHPRREDKAFFSYLILSMVSKTLLKHKAQGQGLPESLLPEASKLLCIS